MNDFYFKRLADTLKQECRMVASIKLQTKGHVSLFLVKLLKIFEKSSEDVLLGNKKH